MTYCSVVAVLVLVGLTKKRFGQYATLKILSIRTPRSRILSEHIYFPGPSLEKFDPIKAKSVTNPKPAFGRKSG